MKKNAIQMLNKYKNRIKNAVFSWDILESNQ